MNAFYLTQADYECHHASWAGAATDYCRRGFPVHYEGIDWQQACRDHGFWGAVDKVKTAYRQRQYRRLIG